MIRWALINILSLGLFLTILYYYPFNNINFKVLSICSGAICFLSAAGKIGIEKAPFAQQIDLKPKLYLAFISIKLLFTMFLFLLLIYKFGKEAMRETVLSCTAFYGLILLEDLIAIANPSKSIN